MPELTVASFNVHWAAGPKREGYRPFDLVDAVRTLDADVVVLQESWAPDDGPAQHDLVAEALGYTAVVAPLARATAVPHPKVVGRGGPGISAATGTGNWCLAVLSRHRVVATSATWLPQLPTDPSTRALLRADLDIDGNPLAVCGTHLAHLEMGVALIAPSLRRALPPAHTPAVLMGDMNMWGWCISAMTPRGWTRHGRGATFPSVRPLARIDHLLTTRSVAVVDTAVLPDLGSDHRAIRARLSLGGGGYGAEAP